MTNDSLNEAPYGYCPTCLAKGVSRERRPDGNDVCENKHTYPSRYARGKTAVPHPPIQKPLFPKETDLCEYFIGCLPKGWTAYRETGDFDILLVRDEDGFQIGIEAKLKLNAKVVCQAAEDMGYYYANRTAPDCRAVLVPHDAGSGELKGVCRRLGIEVISVIHKASNFPSYSRSTKFYPDLPDADNCWSMGEKWFEYWPEKRITLPDYIPDTKAGDSCPIRLTPWKVAAMKIAVLLDRTGYVSRQDFQDLKISISRWTQGGLMAWLKPYQVRGQYQRTERMPNFALQHPVNYQQIADDFENWNPRKGKLQQQGMAL